MSQLPTRRRRQLLENASAKAEAERLIDEALTSGSDMLDLDGLRITRLPERILGLATQLRHLSLAGCRRLVDVVELARFESLQSLNLNSCSQLSELSPLAGLSSLKSLYIRFCPRLYEFGPLAGLSSLQTLDLSHCPQLSDFGPLAKLSSLQHLGLRYCPQLSKLDPLAGLSSLRSLDLDECDQLAELTALAGLSSLQSLRLSSYPQISELGPLARLASLQSLTFSFCTQLNELDALARLSSLQSLTLSFCDQLRELGPLAELSSLKSIALISCPHLSDLNPLAGLSALHSLAISSCPQLSDLKPLASLSALHSLDISSSPQLSDLGPLVGLSSLQSLDVSHCTQLRELGPLAALSSLQSIDLSHCDQPRELEPLTGLSSLQRLNLSSCSELRELGPLVGLSSLQSLNLSHCPQLSDLNALAGLTSLQSLSLNHCPQLSELGPLAGLASLQQLDLGACPQLSELAPLARLSSLHSLQLGSCLQLRDLSPLAGLSSLRSLFLSFCPQISELSPLAGLSSLQGLLLYCCPQISELGPLAKLPALRSLNLSHCPELRELAPLAGLSSLRGLQVGFCPHLGEIDPLAGLPSLESLELSSYLQPRELSILTGLLWLKRLKIADVPLDMRDPVWLSQKLPRLETLIATELRGAPVELASKESSDCLLKLEAWCDDMAAGGGVPCDTVKLFVLGNGGAGKTQIVRRLGGLEFDETVPSTHGVQTGRIALLKGSSRRPGLAAHVWDFGGQDIYLGTHSLFIDARAIYLVAWTPKTENEDVVADHGIDMRNRRLEEWLRHIRALAGPKAPVIVVQSQCDRESLRQEDPLPEDHGFGWLQRTACSAREDDGLDRLWPELRAAARLLQERHGEVLLPRSWMQVTQVLRRHKARRRRVIDRAVFDTACEDAGVSAPSTTLQYLHQAGEVFSRSEVFGGAVVLDQAWALEGLYALLHRAKVLPLLRQRGGHFTRDLLGALIWDAAGYTPAEQRQLLSMMAHCGACFAIGDGHYLAPDALPSRSAALQREAAIWRDASAACRIELRYQYLHEGMMRSLVSKIGEAGGPDAVYWRYGAAYFDGDARTAMRIDCSSASQQSGLSGGATVVIEAAERSAATHLQELAQKLADLFQLSEKPSMVWTVGQPGATPPAPTTRDHPDDPEGGPAKPLLRAVHPPLAPGELPLVHVSYAWGGDAEQFVDALEARLRGACNWRRDKRAMRPGDWISDFMDEIARARCVVLVISDKSLRSAYCMRELQGLFQTSQAQKSQLMERIIPVVMSDACIDRTADRVRRAKYWKRVYANNEQSAEGLDSAERGSEFALEQQMIGEFRLRVADMLKWVGDVLMPRPGMVGVEPTIEAVCELIERRLRLAA